MQRVVTNKKQKQLGDTPQKDSCKYKHDCNITGHSGHDWFDCENNHKSKYYKVNTIMMQKQQSSESPKKDSHENTEDLQVIQGTTMIFDTPSDKYNE